MTSTPYVFISHSSKNNALARRLHHDLTAVGLTSWLDVHAIRDGERWVSQIESAVAGCAVMVMIHTRSARSSEWVERELLLALEHNKPILIARFEDVPLPLPLITRQYTDFSNYASGLEHLTVAIQHLLASSILPAPVEPDPLTDEEQFFLYLSHLPHGSLISLVARDLYTWANSWADDLVFKGQHAPSMYVQQQIGERLVALFAIRGYVQNPAVQIAFDHLLRHVPSLHLRLDSYYERLTSLQPPPKYPGSAPLRRPTVTLKALDTAEKLETLKGLIDELREHLQAVP